jgi:aromatic ring-opening dioxygenase catalytic subunit (LigB family)
LSPFAVWYAYGASPSFLEPLRRLVPKEDIPIVAIHVNANRPPALSGRRMHRFGQALSEILTEWEGHVALLASGGLAHDHGGARGGWIDESLDRFVLERYRRGRSADLQSMFDVESDAMNGGGAQIRLWNAVAAAAEAQGTRAEIVDYIPSFSIAAGVGFAYWPVTPAQDVPSEGTKRVLAFGTGQFN